MQRIIFFDGICVLCDGFINYVFKIDKKRQFKFAPLQSKAAASLLQTKDLGLSSVVYLDADRVYTQSNAVLKIMYHIGGIWAPISILLTFIPRPLRDRVYQFIAENRYSWFGKNDVCRLPSKEEKEFFLD